ncbi:hypothetical protein LTR66_017363 [Elasticomyces elasticus]|nr:hypothetical protein LTR66_017363 [Elasticomyces elasticus]
MSQTNRILSLMPGKALAAEMLHALAKTCSGLVSRPVYFLPVSRHTNMDQEMASQMQDLFRKCQDDGGVLLILPEHLNSFRLLGVDKLAGKDDDRATSRVLLETRKWLDRNARDILDESDALLKPNFELIYTSGDATLLAGAPDRWNLTMQFLTIVQRNAQYL